MNPPHLPSHDLTLPHLSNTPYHPTAPLLQHNLTCTAQQKSLPWTSEMAAAACEAEATRKPSSNGRLRLPRSWLPLRSDLNDRYCLPASSPSVPGMSSISHWRAPAPVDPAATAGPPSNPSTAHITPWARASAGLSICNSHGFAN